MIIVFKFNRAGQQDGLLDADAVEKLWRQHLCGWQDHSDVLWSILMFQAWLDQA
jgi:asparagine synthase (glutamine-hydrolysing)